MRALIRIIWCGFLSWLIPFLIAIPFYSPAGDLLVDQDLFKSIMIITGALVGSVLMVHLFKIRRYPFLKTGILIGCIWLFINWIIDLLILLPLMNYDLTAYMSQIGLRYFIIPIMAIMSGYIARNTAREYV
jgi:uncharacterized membrane protein YpjA